MTEIVCQLCNVQTPENAFYCQQCGQPLRCKNCHAHLLPNARACIQCGQLIPERTANEEAHMGMISIPIGYNRLKLHETPDLCDLDLTVSNEAIANLGDLLPSLMGTRPRRHNGNLVNNQPQKQSDSVEVAPETVPSQPQLPPASSKTDSPNAIQSDLIWEIFRKQEGGGLKQDIINLKASGKKDYTMRLVYLYLYARFKLDEDIVSRNDIYTFLDNVNPNLRDSNMSHYISQAQGISSDESGTLRLTYEGRRKAEQYIDDVFNPDLVDSWPSNSDTRSTNARTKRQGKKSGEHHNINDTEVSEWMQHAVSKDLISAIDHSTIVALSLVDKALLALYGIYMSGNEQEIALSLITKYLYSAFDVQVKASSLSKALYKVREEKTGKSSYVNFREGSGYKITPSGRKYMEERLQLQHKQLLTASENNALNGVK